MKIKTNGLCAGRFFTVFFLIIFPIGFAHELIFAQAGQGELLVEARDANDAVIDRAQIALTEIATARRIEPQTKKNGAYIFTNLRPGIYRIEISAANFSRYIQEKITITTGERLRITAQLSVSAGQEIVTVSSSVPLLRSETSSLGQIIDNKKIIDLPLNGCSFLSLVGLAQLHLF